MAVEWYELPKYRLERGLGDAISCIVLYLYRKIVGMSKEDSFAYGERMEWLLETLAFEDYGIAKEEKARHLINMWNNNGYRYPSVLYDVALSEVLMFEKPIDELQYLEALRQFAYIGEELMKAVIHGEKGQLGIVIGKIKRNDEN